MYEAADELLRHILYSNAYATFAYQTSIRLALLGTDFFTLPAFLH